MYFLVRSGEFDPKDKKKTISDLRESLKRSREHLARQETRLEHERNVRKGCVVLPSENYRALLRSGKTEIK